jgi:hypothetical protein
MLLVNVWPVERNVATFNWRPQLPPAPASYLAAVKGCERRGGCGDWKVVQTSFLAVSRGNSAFVRNHLRQQIRMIVADWRLSILDECQVHTHLMPILESRATGPGR